MLVQREYQYKLYPTKEQIDLLINHCFVSNQVHNILINIQMKEFELNKNKLSLNPQLKIYSQKIINNSKHYLKDKN